MSKKNRKKRGREIPRPEGIRRLLEKGDAKVAVKEAKRCFRSDPSPAHQSLLEEALLGRVEQLHRKKQIADAKIVLSELLGLKPTSPSITSKLARLQVMVGDATADTSAILSEDPALLIELVDQAVLHEGMCIPDIDNLPAQVEAVQEALAAIERSEDEAAAERLAIVPRNSPLADWRLFARGLIAFYEQDDERTRQNWKRLEVSRPASRIARTFMAAAGLLTEDRTAELAGGIRKLEMHVRTNSLVDILKDLTTAWRQDDWRRVLHHYRQLQLRYGKSHKPLLQQVIDVIWMRPVRQMDYSALLELASIGPAPEIDPKFNRAKALLIEHEESVARADELEYAWLSYAGDVERLKFFSEEERPVVLGLVYQRLGRVRKQEADEFSISGHYYGARLMDDTNVGDDELLEKLLEKSVHHFQASIDVCPQLKTSYLELATIYEEQEKEEDAGRTMEKLVRHDPDCFEAVTWLAHHHLSRNDPAKAERYVNAVQRLRPRDPVCETLRWNHTLSTVNCLTVNRQFEAARHEIKALDELDVSAKQQVERFTLDLLRAGVEFKAKNLERAQEHLDTALSKVDEPVAIWLQMSAVAARMRVAREFKKDFDDRFKADIQKPPTSASAGRMTRFLFVVRNSKWNYTGRATQERLLIKYVERARNIAWQEPDLRKVCEFLSQFPRQVGLFEDMLEIGVESFPQTPHFHFWQGLIGRTCSSYSFGLEQLIQCFETTLKLHAEGDIKLSDSEVEKAQELLSLSKDNLEQEQSLGREFRFLDYDDDDEDEDDEDEYTFDPAGWAPRGARDDSAAPTKLSDDQIAELKRTMPPPIKRALEEVARKNGQHFDEAFMEFIRVAELAGVGDTLNP